MKNPEEKNFARSDTYIDVDDVNKFVLYTLLNEDDIQAFLSKVYERYNIPIIVTDMAFRLIAYAGPVPCEDPLWQKIIETGEAEPETVIKQYLGDGFTDKMILSEGAMDATWGITADFPQSTCTVRIDGTAEGCCSLLYMDKSRLEFSLELNAAAAAAVAIYLSGKKTGNQANNRAERPAIARLLLENTSTPISLIYGTNFYRKEKFEPSYMTAVISAKEHNAARMQNIVASIRAKYPDLLYMNKEEDTYLYFWNLRSEKHRKRLLEDIQEETKEKYPAVCGVSALFSDPEERGIYIEQAKLAVEYGKKEGSPGIYTFYDNYLDIITRLGFGNIMPENLVLPEIKTLLEYDRENNTCFYESLKCYLEEYCDLTDAAAKLFIHRNSLLYRLNKCEDIMNVSLKDKDVRKRLNLCCSILKLKENETDK